MSPPTDTKPHLSFLWALQHTSDATSFKYMHKIIAFLHLIDTFRIKTTETTAENSSVRYISELCASSTIKTTNSSSYILRPYYQRTFLA